MYEVTETASHAALSTIEPTTSLPKVCHRAQFAVNRPCRVPATVQRITRFLRILLVFEPCVHIPNQVIVVIVAHDDLFHLAVLAHLAPEVLIEGVEVILEL